MNAGESRLGYCTGARRRQAGAKVKQTGGEEGAARDQKAAPWTSALAHHIMCSSGTGFRVSAMTIGEWRSGREFGGQLEKRSKRRYVLVL
ncbi:hypothetical protein CLCR_05270 [Cladophialophora carrionii]|uniref:Uncharacterized protein n=1 Tax=Cladophialophora carrionii TaxID=86049 RepID=A0A1C1CKE2_9EURO|nr:hypothetical protein CLCR_05270 [Cladophialophora carrionii]